MRRSSFNRVNLAAEAIRARPSYRTSRCARAACATAALWAAPWIVHVRGGETTQKQDPPRESASTVRAEPDDRLTFHVVDLPLADALRMLSEPARRNIVLTKNATGTVSASLYNVTFEKALEAVLASSGLGYRTEGDFVFVHPLDELAGMAQARRQLSTRVFRLSYVNAKSAKELIDPLLTKGVGTASVTEPAGRGLGGDQGPDDTQGDALATGDAIVVTDYEDRLETIAQVLKDLDVRPRQVLIEATILRATLNEENSLGIDFTTVGGIDFGTLQSVSPAAQSVVTGTTPNQLLGDTTFTARTDFNGALPTGGFTFGIIKDQVGVFIRALEQITDTTILAHPKVLALNKQTGEIIVGRRDGYFTVTVTETTTVQTVEFLETGTVLSFRPFIGDDGFVRMEIHPKDSTGGITQANLPFEQTTEVTTNVLVKDGHTILIGGLFREVDTATRGQIPVLGNIPIAGALFRSTGDATVREEVIILLTVHVIKGDGDADAVAGDKLYEDVERFRVGTRRGLQWLGRERLAQAHYRWALEHLARGEIDKAVWDAHIATHVFSRHVPAAKLREELTNRRMWESEGSAVRTFVQDRIAEESGVIRPAFGRPGPPYEVPDGLKGPSGLEDDGADEPDAHGDGGA